MREQFLRSFPPAGHEASGRKRVPLRVGRVRWAAHPRAEAVSPIGGSSPFRSLARGCGESFIGGTPGVTPFRRLLRRHIPALGCSTPDEEGAPRDAQATRTTSPAAARSTRATATPEDPPQRRRHRHWQQEPLGVGTRRSRPTASARVREFHARSRGAGDLARGLRDRHGRHGVDGGLLDPPLRGPRGARGSRSCSSTPAT